MREGKKEKEKENTCKPRNFPLSLFFSISAVCMQLASSAPKFFCFFVFFYTKNTSMESQVFLATVIKIILIRTGTTC